jgi:hypothetical protein
MPIRVTCQCGHTLTVPDEMAGKSGKCPKCKQLLQVPAGSTNPTSGSPKPQGTPGAAKPNASKPATSPVAPATSSAGQMAGLFDEVGLTQKKGKFCPSCDAQVTGDAVICVKCGFHLSEGKKVDGFQAAASKKFGNKQLNEAADMMAREKATETRLLGTGAPWWMLAALLIGLAVFIGGLAIKMDFTTSGKISSVEPLARIQKATYGPVIAASLGFAMVLVFSFAHIALLVTAFLESAKQGFLFLFLPVFYSTYYMFSRIKTKNLMTTVIIYFVSAIVAGISLGYSLPKI